jgi:hypothetical protein
MSVADEAPARARRASRGGRLDLHAHPAKRSETEVYPASNPTIPYERVRKELGLD